MKCAIGELADMMKKKFGEDESEAKKDEMSAESETDMKYENAEDGVHIDIGSHEGAPDSVDIGEEDEEAMPVVAARSTYALRSENARLKSRMERLEAEVRREKFSREIDILEQDGYRIPESQRDDLMSQAPGQPRPGRPA